MKIKPKKPSGFSRAASTEHGELITHLSPLTSSFAGADLLKEVFESRSTPVSHRFQDGAPPSSIKPWPAERDALPGALIKFGVAHWSSVS